MKLYHPYLAKCDNRNRFPREHPESGKPEEWIERACRHTEDLSSISFDFFVDWSTSPHPELAERIWIKRIVDDPPKSWPDVDDQSIAASIHNYDGTRFLRSVGKFSGRNDLTAQYILFDDTESWESENPPLVAATVDESGTVSAVRRVRLTQVMKVIRTLSGGPVSIGSKGLIYGTSRLECYLSTTSSLWPGDADAVLLDKDHAAVSVLEFKKHTRRGNGRLRDQTLSDYYPRPDKRKYHRLQSLCNEIRNDVSLTILYYPTETHESIIKIEKISGGHNGLSVDNSRIVELPHLDQPDTCKKIVEEIVSLNK